MKKLIFGLLALTVAIGGSAFTNAKTTHTSANGLLYTSGFLVQTQAGTWTYQAAEDINDGICVEPTLRLCKYEITSEIPTKSSYTYTEVNTTYSANLDAQETDGNFIYEIQ